MRRNLAVQLVVFVFMSLFAHGAIGANVLEKLMMPGELSRPHAELEADCANCHKTLEKRAQSSLCLDCHKPIRESITQAKGFHGKNALVGKSECADCHVEHKGRDFTIVRLEKITFNHDETNFPLSGKHKGAACEGCHEAKKKFSAAPHTCFACHEKDQPHKGRLGNDCQTCHVVEGWKKLAAFDHDKTKFPLKGAHSSVVCMSCHVGEVYKGLSTACNDCHAIQDIHATRFGTACQDCHTVEKWKGAKFDHDKQTKFALKGAHAKAQCADCHGADVRAKIATTCISCHKAQDVHQAKLGAACETCHGTTTWKRDIKFDHDATSYPLIGLHAVVACEACHESRAYVGAPKACIACHASDDVHLGRFAKDCGSCHTPVGWPRITFDHGRNTRFALTGAHAKVGCYGCHTQKNVTSAKLSMTCYACHKQDDVHRGKFGTNCARCHTTATFKSAFIPQ